ncbi:MAG: NAD(P)-binding domain-containing protein [Burkholderiaceae bacterium]|nr:NAD(P)-binding domain-containing protein [Burkholderiaceae bacterium]
MNQSSSGAAALNVVLYGDIILPNEYRLRAKADFPVNVTSLGDDASAEQKEAALGAADAVVCVRFDHPSRNSPNLRLVQLQAAGYDKIDFQCVPDAAAVCNAFGHDRAIAEYAIMTMLMWTHRWKPVEQSFRAGSWKYSGSMYGPLRDELNSKTVGILGFGHMGKEIAECCRAMGVRVLACARNPQSAQQADAHYPIERLDEFLGQCDFVVVCIALVPQTEGLIDSARLARMKRDAVLVNLARGPIVVEGDLYEALRSGTIAGAVIDVWWQYPDASDPQRRGSRFPFHELDNVLMTPHSSGWTEQMMDRRWDMIMANLRATWRREPLINLVRGPVGAP